MNKVVLSMAAAMSLVTSTAQADFLGLYVGAGSWSHDPSGSFNSVGDASIDLGSDLALSDESETYSYIAFEHPVPLIPNIRFESTGLTHEGNAGSVTFNGQTVSGASVISLDSTDTVLYWRLLDNWVNFDLGLNARKLDGEFSVGAQTKPLSETIPMVYVAAQFDMPFTGLSVGADLNYSGLDGNTLEDLRIRAIYEMGVIGFEGGVRTTSIKLDDVDGVNADLEFDGIFLGAFLHF